jgi:hypothetical protein
MTLPPKPIHSRRQVWLAIKNNGYDVIPLKSGKDSPFRHWPSIPNEPADIATWNGRAAAIRTYGTELFIIDNDTTAPAARAAVMAVIGEKYPAFLDQCLHRHSGAVKIALIGRTTRTSHRLLRTRSWYPSQADLPAEGDDEETLARKKAVKNMTEFFTGNLRKYLGVWGMHSPGREYGYDGDRTILNTRLDALPIFPAEDIEALRDALDEAYEHLGFFPASLVRPDSIKERVLYDLEPEQVFELSDGVTKLTLAQLDEELRKGRNIREEGYARIWDKTSGSPDRVKVNLSREGLSLWDTRTEVRHRFRDEVLRRGGFDEAKIAARLTELGVMPPPETGQQVPPASCPPDQNEDKNAHNGRDDQSRNEEPEPDGATGAPPRPTRDDPIRKFVQWLIATHAYCAPTGTVVELYEPSDACHITMEAFTQAYMDWSVLNHPLKGIPKLQYATKMWSHQPERHRIRGVRMHPGAAFPLFCEEGHTYKNTYRPPRHSGDGDLAVWWAFITHLLPDPIEREWFLDWLAHKFQHPEIPSVAVIMVAVDEEGRPVYGAGRGMLKDILSRLFGWSYVRPIDFDVFNGRSAQGVYTDWAAYALIVFVSESRDNAEAGRWTERRAVYERIKEVVDPRPVLRTFTSKGRPAFQGVAYASYLIASNNGDALQIPAGDRRISALRNGPSMTESMAQALDAWMNAPGNIAALARMLAGRDLSKFDAYSPLHTATKATMQELALSEMDEWFIEVRKRLGPDALFTSEHLLAAAKRDIGPETGVIGFQITIKRRLRAEAMQAPSHFANLRTARSTVEREHKILCWRGYQGPVVGNSVAARELVNLSRAILLEDKEAGDTAALMARLGIHSVDQ